MIYCYFSYFYYFYYPYKQIKLQRIYGQDESRQWLSEIVSRDYLIWVGNKNESMPWCQFLLFLDGIYHLLSLYPIPLLFIYYFLFIKFYLFYLIFVEIVDLIYWCYFASTSNFFCLFKKGTKKVPSKG